MSVNYRKPIVGVGLVCYYDWLNPECNPNTETTGNWNTSGQNLAPEKVGLGTIGYAYPPYYTKNTPYLQFWNPSGNDGTGDRIQSTELSGVNMFPGTTHSYSIEVWCKPEFANWDDDQVAIIEKPWITSNTIKENFNIRFIKSSTIGGFNGSFKDHDFYSYGSRGEWCRQGWGIETGSYKINSLEESRQWFQVVFVVDFANTYGFSTSHVAMYVNSKDHAHSGIQTMRPMTSDDFSCAFTSNENFGVGRCWDVYDEDFQGKMGPIRIYNRALLENEVNQNFDAQRERFGI
tara:strand:- start:102 stop:971 length:870 start_codon:yes stop_codon:yes gene_type:complete